MSESSRSRSGRPLEKITTNNPVDSSFLSEVLHSIVLKADKDGDLVALPVILIDPMQPVATPFKSCTHVTANGHNINAAGSVATWTPVAGRRARLLAFNVVLSKEAACAGALTLSILDSAGNIIWIADVSSAALVAIGNVVSFVVTLPGNGYLAPLGSIYLNLNAALTAGFASISMYGAEE